MRDSRIWSSFVDVRTIGTFLLANKRVTQVQERNQKQSPKRDPIEHPAAEHRYLAYFSRWLWGGVANGAKVSVSPFGSLTVDRAHLHSTDAYKRQLEALKLVEERLTLGEKPEHAETE